MYIFTLSGNTWTEQVKLTSSDGIAKDNFGYSISLLNGILLVGAYHCNISGNVRQGAAYVFSGSGSSWTQEAKLVASNGAAGDNFGCAVGVDSSGALLVGSHNAQVGSNKGQGAVYGNIHLSNHDYLF